MKTYLTKGKRGIISAITWEGKPAVIKERNPASKTDSLAREALMLKKANAVGVGPELYYADAEKVVMERIDGVLVGEWIATASRREVRAFLRELLDQCRALDKAGITKHEMNHPHKHIIIRAGKPIQVDFERAIFTERPKNVTQVCQWYTSREIADVLKGRGIILQKDPLDKAAKDYKATYADREYRTLREMV